VITKPNQPCSGCPLWAGGRGFIPASGSGASGILLVGEAGSAAEESLGHTQISGHLESILRRAGMEKDQFSYTNVLSCRPPRNELTGARYEHEAISCCAPLLDDTIGRMAPKVIVALGNTALRRLAGESNIGRYRGYILDGPQGIPVIATYDPSYLLPRKGEQSSSKWTGAVGWDLKRAAHIAKHGFQRAPVDYLIDPTPARAAAFVTEYLLALAQDPGTYLTYDIETVGSLRKRGNKDEVDASTELVIVRISFAFRERHAMSIPWAPEYQPVIDALLGSAGRKCGWNCKDFDDPILERNGKVIKGERHDAMNAFHVLLPNLPKKLEIATSFFAWHIKPWKHLSQAEPGFYSCVDADANLVDMLAIEKALRGIAIPEYLPQAA
jgi:uracil-DNA glycosylase family 4